MGGLLNVVQSVKDPKATNSNFHKQIEMQIRELMRRTGVEVDEQKLEKLAKYMKPMKQQNEMHGLNFVNVTIKDQSFKALFDTGAICSLIDKTVAEKLKLEILPSDKKLSGTDGNAILIAGKVVVELMLNNVQNYHEFIVMENCGSMVLLGIDFINGWKIKSDFANKIYQIGDDTQNYKFCTNQNQQEIQQKEVENSQVLEYENEQIKPKRKVERPKKLQCKHMRPENNEDNNQAANKANSAMQRKNNTNKAINNIESGYLKSKTCVNNLTQMEFINQNHSKEVINIHCTSCQHDFHDGFNYGKLQNKLCHKYEQTQDQLRVCKKIQEQCLVCVTNDIQQKKQIKNQVHEKCEVAYCKTKDENEFNLRFGTLIKNSLTSKQLDAVIKDLIKDKAVKINKIKHSKGLIECRCNYCSVYNNFKPFLVMTKQEISEKVREFARKFKNNV